MGVDPGLEVGVQGDGALGENWKIERESFVWSSSRAVALSFSSHTFSRAAACSPVSCMDLRTVLGEGEDRERERERES